MNGAVPSTSTRNAGTQSVNQLEQPASWSGEYTIRVRKKLPRIFSPGLRLSLRNIKGQWIVSALFFLLGSISTKRSHGQIPEFSSPGCGNMYMGGPAPRIN
ncbi:hypothetical protein H0G86_003127 [Trichoderma simmonsii]|uniref:Uncharacterized protein n=1 Tax=Trichoderma simmonsii TaxID=1491479 RepID=A0A8G0L4W8_9HYPO|nr:hypothetical protein H0G86_003127 [Trichoderma simmonsii]